MERSAGSLPRRGESARCWLPSPVGASPAGPGSAGQIADGVRDLNCAICFGTMPRRRQARVMPAGSAFFRWRARNRDPHAAAEITWRRRIQKRDCTDVGLFIRMTVRGTTVRGVACCPPPMPDAMNNFIDSMRFCMFADAALSPGTLCANAGKESSKTNHAACFIFTDDMPRWPVCETTLPRRR